MRRLSLKLRNLFRRLDQSRTSRGQTRRRLALEQLEDRLAPANASGMLSGTAFIDANGNGGFDPGEVTLPGVPVTLTGTTTQATPVSATASTDGKGAFSFLNVLPGTYQLSAGPVPSLFSAPGAQAGVVLVTGLQVAGGQTLTQNLAFLGLKPEFISQRQFLGSTTPADFLPAGTTPGSGTGQANSRPNSAPIVKTPIGDQSVDVNSADTSIDLAGHFSDPDLADSQVTFNVTHLVNGQVQTDPIHVTLHDATAPQTVANFYDYILSGKYNNLFFSRLMTNFVLQGGGATFDAGSSSVQAVTPFAPVPSEFSLSNTAGTIAMGLSGPDSNHPDPNSGAAEFFFNLIDNSGGLDAKKFTVFGEVADAASRAVLASLATTPTQDLSSAPALKGINVDFGNVPLNNYTGGPATFPSDATTSNFLFVSSITVDNRPEFLTYSVVSNSNPDLVTTSLVNERLTLSYTPHMSGSATITVRATDRFGVSVDDTFTVSVRPKITAVTIDPDSLTNATSLTATPTSDPDSLHSQVTFSYQWFHNTAPIPNATSQTLDLTPLTINKGDQFSVQVTPHDGDVAGAIFASGVKTVLTAPPDPITFSP
jgi:cyclophilin family peptidyl-prolyl cis-trans isomerase